MPGAIVGSDPRGKLAGAEVAHRGDQLLLVRSQGEVEHGTNLLRWRRSRTRGGRRAGLWRRAGRGLRGGRWARSEEHTSELQSLRHLVCRLLLEKKKTKECSSEND